MDESFLDKLKKDMETEESPLQEFEVTAASNTPKKSSSKKKKTPKKESVKKIKIREENAPEEPTKLKESWFDPEGELAVDVYQTEKELVIQSAIAGVGCENLDITIEKDHVAIRGARKNPADQGADYFYKECYWGRFAREIILPEEVDNSRAEAVMKNGVLIIRMPKIEREKKRKLSVKAK